MTQKFKFGDRVHHPKYGECMVVTQWYDTDTEDPTWVSIISEVHGECDARHEELEPIPHPDTVRLDWIEETFGNNEMLILKTGVGRTYRQTIDKAMQQEQTK